MRRILAGFLAAIVLAPLAQAQRGNPEITFAGETVDQMIAAYMKEHDVPGMAVAIVQAPYITRVAGYGLSDAETGRLVASHTLFDIGEMAEAYLAVAVIQLVEEGKLSLDDPADKHIPGAAKATVRQLVQHQSGLPRTLDYTLLGDLIAKAAGVPAETYIRANQIDRLGLKQTFFASELDGLKWEKTKHGEFLRDPQLINPTEPATGTSAKPSSPTGGLRLFASAMDVSFWDIGLAGDILIKDPALRKILYQPTKGQPSSGPWYFPGHPGLMVTTGSGGGFSSLLSRFTDPKELVCVTLLANRDGLDLTQLARRIAGAYDPKIGPPPQTASLRAQQSPYSVKETLDRLESILKDRGVGIVARIDHTKAAQAASLELPATGELIFGNPADGTLLMQQNRAIAADLPLRAACWEENGSVWIAATDPVVLAEKYGILDREEVVQKMRQGIDSALRQAVGAP
jgi:CubicO group peptidase (beta-lactamase class C family)